MEDYFYSVDYPEMDNDLDDLKDEARCEEAEIARAHQQELEDEGPSMQSLGLSWSDFF